MISGTNRFWGTSNRRKSLLGANTYFTHLILGIIYSYWFIFLALLTYLWFQEFEVWGFESSSIRFACYILLLLIFVWFSVYIFWFCGLLVALARDFKQLLALTSTGLLLLSPIYFQFQSPDSNLEKILQSLNVFGHFIEFSHQVLFASSFQVNSKFLYLLFPLCVILMSIILKNFRLHVESAIIRISQVDKSEDFE
jgi:ABC-type polysaccharide/polyol phosphate export permease